MTREQCIALVRGYLGGDDLAFQENSERDSFRIAYGSSAVYIDFFAIGDRTGVRVHAPVLADVKPDAPLERLATINAEVSFGKFAFYEPTRTIEVEYDLLGWTLDADELHQAVHVVGDLADGWDDRLLADFGGKLHAPPEDPTAAGTEAADV